MSSFHTLKEELASTLNKILDQVDIQANDFVLPPDSALGDLALPCFNIAKALKSNPIAVAQEIVEKVNHPLVVKVTADGPYVNFSFSFSIIKSILKEIKTKKGSYGHNQIGKKQRVMLEYANGNTHKEFHVGHLRNIAFGDAVHRVLAANGYSSIPVSYINDFGIHVAKTVWYYDKYILREENLERKDDIKFKEIKEGIRSYGWLLGRIYSFATEELQNNIKGKEEVSKVMKEIESKKGEFYDLWAKTRQWSLNQFKEINQELGVKFKEIFYESDFIGDGLQVVQELLQKGILVKSEGAIIANLEPYNLGVLVVIRSDGTALYPVADLALTRHKVKKYKLDTSLWVVDIRQGQYLHQLFKVLELAGLKAHLAHLPYEFVKLPSGVISSRSGNIVAYEDLKAEALKRTAEEVKSRHQTWPAKKVKAVAEVIAFGALKFEMVKVNGEKIITFDMDTALRFEGYTAAYLQYTYARIQSLLRKAKTQSQDKNMKLEEAKEKQIALVLSRFGKVVQLAGETYQPSEIARYLYELAQIFNEYYHAVPIASYQARLELAQAVSRVIENGLELLGVEVVEEM